MRNWNTNYTGHGMAIGEAWKCTRCGLMVTEGHICKVRETIPCPDCNTLLEKGLEEQHFRFCHVRKARVKAERAAQAKVRRDERNAKGLVGYVHKLPTKEFMNFMEPDVNGHWNEIEIEKFPWKCKICGLVWQTREDAEGCPYTRENPFVRPKSPHAEVYQRMYGVRYVENGAPRGNLYTIDFKAIRREEPEKLPEGKTWDIPVLAANPYGHGSVQTQKRKAEEEDYYEQLTDAEAHEMGLTRVRAKDGKTRTFYPSE